VKRGDRSVGLDKELIEKLGGSDPCPCGFRRCCRAGGRFDGVLGDYYVRE
jgi:hypothetical protein